MRIKEIYFLEFQNRTLRLEVQIRLKIRLKYRKGIFKRLILIASIIADNMLFS